ncbi:MAG: (Fe-S)-binding protein [Calditrichaeota bacterium]|nr:MAG: (Fe-S)-binding protein [Calditrichota bacterium]
MTSKQTPISIFIPCLVDQVYPEMGLAMVKVLEHLGYSVSYDSRQTCCGQPAFNAGHWQEARQVAGCFIDVFKDAEIIVCPSGSCTAMVRHFYSQLFAGRPQQRPAAQLAGKIFEISEFLDRQGDIEKIHGKFPGKIGFHNSCHSYRELRIADPWQKILAQIEGIEWAQPEGEPVCCGFGGIFSFKYAPIATAMAKTRLEMFVEKGAETIISNDPGCIMHMRQQAAAQGLEVNILHLVEFLQQAMLAPA